MSKSKSSAALAEPEALAEVEASEPAQLPTRKYRVHLEALTPIEHKTAEVRATSQDEAWSKFCELNGITDSGCDRTITEV